MKFSILSLALGTSSYAEFELLNKPERSDPPRCEDCGTKLSPLVRMPPYKYKWKKGVAGDLLTDGMVFAVSERFRIHFEESELTGLTFSEEPIELKGSAANYYMAFPQVTRTLLDEAASGVVINNLRGCEKCRVMSIVKLDRVVIREETWPESDIFMMGNLFSEIVLTQRFLDFVTSSSFTNFHFTDQDDFQIEYSFLHNDQ